MNLVKTFRFIFIYSTLAYLLTVLAIFLYSCDKYEDTIYDNIHCKIYKINRREFGKSFLLFNVKFE